MTLPPSALGRDLARALSVAHNAVVTRSGVPMSTEDHSALTARLHEVADALTPTVSVPDRSVVAAALTDLFLSLKSRAGDEGDSREVLRVYGEALRDLPAWTIVEGCQRPRLGEAGLSLVYVPTTAELRQVCLKIVEPVRTERARLMAVLSAPEKPTIGPATEDSKARVARILAEAKRSLGSARHKHWLDTLPHLPPGMTQAQFDALPEAQSTFRRVGDDAPPSPRQQGAA